LEYTGKNDKGISVPKVSFGFLKKFLTVDEKYLYLKS